MSKEIRKTTSERSESVGNTAEAKISGARIEKFADLSPDAPLANCVSSDKKELDKEVLDKKNLDKENLDKEFEVSRDKVTEEKERELRISHKKIDVTDADTVSKECTRDRIEKRLKTEVSVESSSVDKDPANNNYTGANQLNSDLATTKKLNKESRAMTTVNRKSSPTTATKSIDCKMDKESDRHGVASGDGPKSVTVVLPENTPASSDFQASQARVNSSKSASNTSVASDTSVPVDRQLFDNGNGIVDSDIKAIEVEAKNGKQPIYIESTSVKSAQRSAESVVSARETAIPPALPVVVAESERVSSSALLDSEPDLKASATHKDDVAKLERSAHSDSVPVPSSYRYESDNYQINYNEPEIRDGKIGTFKSQALSMIRMPSGFGVLAICSASMVLITAACLIFVPWQQSISGRGKVIIFSPMERPQHIEAPIQGRISRWYVRDGQNVQEGDPIVELAEVDPKYLGTNQLEQIKKQKSAQVAKKEAAQARASALLEQLRHLKISRTSSVDTADTRMSQAHDNLAAAEQSVVAAKQNLKTAELNFERLKKLFDNGLRSKRDLELSELELVSSKASVERAVAQLYVARKETSVAEFDVKVIDAKTSAELESINAAYNSAMEMVATTETEIQKLELDIHQLENRIKQRILKSPCSGKVVRLFKTGAGETVSAGVQLAVIAPKTEDLAAELFVEGNDAPLVTPGRHVRLQFAGWPSVQFTGWPSVAVGTFAGKVAVIDPVDDGAGRFRIIVVPDTETVAMYKDEPWPDCNYLRPGSEVHGWVMLNTVSLGFELWRQFNAFPPALDVETSKSSTGNIKRKLKS